MRQGGQPRHRVIAAPAADLVEKHPCPGLDDRYAHRRQDLLGDLRLEGQVGAALRVLDRAADGLLDLRIEQGTTLGLIGPNGGGKSTLLKVMLGLIKPDQLF